MRVKAVITDVSDSTKGPAIVVSRRNSELIKKLFELEVPEIADKLVEIVGVAREPGYRSKIAVISHADGVDPVGACVGPRGSRVRMVVSELRGEKIDIIPHNDEPARFVAKALSPARVREVIVDDGERQATVIVPDDQLSLAIGRDGQNARLAARLTGWRVDIKSETEFSQEDQEVEYEGEEQSDGRCMAVLSNGRRCPNAAVPGSTYSGCRSTRRSPASIPARLRSWLPSPRPSWRFSPTPRPMRARSPRSSRGPRRSSSMRWRRLRLAAQSPSSGVLSRMTGRRHRRGPPRPLHRHHPRKRHLSPLRFLSSSPPTESQRAMMRPMRSPSRSPRRLSSASG